MLQVGVAGHLGTSHRTGIDLGVKEKSAIRDHTLKRKASINIKDFKIIDSYKVKLSLLVTESFHIKQIHPTLNNDLSAALLYTA